MGTVRVTVEMERSKRRRYRQDNRNGTICPDIPVLEVFQVVGQSIRTQKCLLQFLLILHNYYMLNSLYPT
jgi:hypothetical protein